MATNLTEKISAIKGYYWRNLALYSGAFVFLYVKREEFRAVDAAHLKGMFLLGGVVLFVINTFFHPWQLWKSRKTLKRVYKRFSKAFEKLKGKSAIGNVDKFDPVEIAIIVLGALYIIMLMIIA